MTDTNEQKWREDARVSLRDNEYYSSSEECAYLDGYLAARKKAQEEIEFWKKEYVSHSEAMIKAQEKVKELEKQLEDKSKMIREWARRSVQLKRERLILKSLLKQAVPWITRMCDGWNVEGSRYEQWLKSTEEYLGEER